MSNGLKSQSWGQTVLRVVTGIVFAMHGYQKIHTFHIQGVTGMLSHLGIPLPAVFAVILIVVELVGGILLISGLATRIPAALLAIDMVVAILTVHIKHGFFAQTGGYEFPLTLLAATVCLAISGGGTLSRKGF
jgi:putative oxidoreductase